MDLNEGLIQVQNQVFSLTFYLSISLVPFSVTDFESLIHPIQQFIFYKEMCRKTYEKKINDHL